MRRLFYLFCILFLAQTRVYAQDIDRDVFIETASLVSKLGPMSDSSLKGIVGAVTAKCNKEACAMYAIYMWTAQNIALDCASNRNPEKRNNSASYVLRTREGNTLGFANLIAEMCKLAHIECEVVNGLAKWDAADIGKVNNEDNSAAWNVVIIGKRRYVLDASMGAGYCDGKRFTRQLTDAWFLCNRRLFALSHFPKDKSQQLLDTAVERSEFTTAPVIGPMAPILGLMPPQGLRGTLRGRAKDTIRLSFEILPTLNVGRIGSAAAGIGEEVIPATIALSGDKRMLTFAFALPKEGKYPLTLMVNNAPAFTFQAQASEALKRRR